MSRPERLNATASRRALCSRTVGSPGRDPPLATAASSSIGARSRTAAVRSRLGRAAGVDLVLAARALGAAAAAGRGDVVAAVLLRLHRLRGRELELGHRRLPVFAAARRSRPKGSGRRRRMQRSRPGRPAPTLLGDRVPPSFSEVARASRRGGRFALAERSDRETSDDGPAAQDRTVEVFEAAVEPPPLLRRPRELEVPTKAARARWRDVGWRARRGRATRVGRLG